MILGKKMYTKKYMIRQFIIQTLNYIVILTLFSFSVFCAPLQKSSNQEKQNLVRDLKIADLDPIFFTVMGGEAICSPIRTSYGYAVLSTGRLINAWTPSGTMLFQKGLQENPSHFLVCTKDDFLLSVIGKRKLSLVNPSGLSLWKTDAGFEITKPPLSGFDGRVFVFGKENVACFGLNGIRKWTIQTDSISDLNAVLLNDGSVVVFLVKEENGKTVGIRISPFGESVERIVFTGKILSSFSCSEGAALCFSDGSLGICAVNDEGVSYSKFKIDDSGLGSGTIFFENSKNELYAASPSTTGTRVICINLKAQNTKWSFIAQDVKGNSLTYFAPCQKEIFVSNTTRAELLSYEGEKIRTIILPEQKGKTQWNHIMYSNGIIIFTLKSWSLTGYKVISGTSEQTPFFTKGNYNKFYKDKPILDAQSFNSITSTRAQTLKNGDYEKNEIIYWNEAAHLINRYIEKKSEKKIGAVETDTDLLFDVEIKHIAPLLTSFSDFGTYEQIALLSNLITIETDETILIAALKAIALCPCDTGGILQNAMELLLKRIQPRQTLVLEEICNCIYSICRFMGRPAIYSWGRAQFSKLFLPQYSNQTRDYARKQLEKLAKLNM